jgi:pimeloyl-ACP methyl ester carboxylesterase
MLRGTLDVRIAGRRIRGVRGGAGPRVLYLHSAMGDAKWLPHLTALAQHFEVVAPLHPAFAASDEDADAGSVAGGAAPADGAALAEELATLLTTLGWSTAAVVGFSLGGWMAAELACRHPLLVSRLVLIAAVGVRLPDQPLADLSAPRAAAELRRLYLHDPQSSLGQLLFLQLASDPGDPVRAGRVAALCEAAVASDLPARLGRLTAPTLCLWGESDRVVPRAYGEELARLIPGARLRIIPAAGHLAPLEQPQAVVGAICEFLA